MSVNKPEDGFSEGSMQGAAILNGVIYQFRGSGTANENIPTYDTYNIGTGAWTKGGSLSALAGSHMGSACFGPKVFTTSDGYTHDCTIPFLYITNGCDIQIYDIEHNVLVATWSLPKLDDDAIAAYDFANGKLWSIGYVVKSRKAPYLIRELGGIDFTVLPTTRTVAESEFTSQTPLGGPDANGVQHDLVNGTLQDCQYVGGKIYIATGGGSSAHRTEFCRVHVYDPSSKAITETRMCTGLEETEGFVYDASGDAFYLTTLNSAIWKLSAGTGYDTMNFEPATLVNGYYEINTASKLLWFKQQVYGGKTDIKGKLTSDIDMTGVTDPYSFYVYDYNIALCGKEGVYPSFFAFGGEFDGNSHTISNYAITKTPYYYDGLFPYCIGANIHDLTVRGSIALTKCDAMVLKEGTTNSYEAKSGQPVANVGLVGYMDGGSVTNVDTKNFTIDYSVVGDDYDSETVSNLIGGRGTNAIYELGNTTSDADHPTHAANGGHKYENGICQCSDACDPASAKYETPGFDEDGTTYLIQNAGNLFWFANKVKTTATANANLANDINLQNIEFTGIGSSSKPYTGTFDGKGFCISGYKQTNSATTTSGTGFFNYIKNATITDFTLEGKLSITGATNNSAFLGGIIGKAETSTITDVTSSVNIVTDETVNGKQDNGIRIVGGISGWSNGSTFNRCRYNGTMTLDSNDGTLGIGDRFAGIVGLIQTGTTNVNNCLFDGAIITKKRSIKVGGLVGQTASTLNINNCLSVGTISLISNSTNCGMVIGVSGGTIGNTYYTIDKLTKDGTSITSGFTDKGTKLTSPYNWKTITEDLIGGAEVTECNWKIVDGREYPIPYAYTRTVYINGFNPSPTSEDDKYEPAELKDGYYEIDNAGKLFWFAKNINSKVIANTSNAKLTDDIDMDGENHADFPGIGIPYGTGKIAFAGNFDGQGHVIENFNMTQNNSDWQGGGFFNYVQGSSKSIKDFTIQGTLAGTCQYLGGVVGFSEGGYDIIDVTCTVNITVNNSKLKHGGIAGFMKNGTINRCRYNGTLDGGTNGNWLGGIVGESYASIQNCLFDGELKSSRNNTDVATGGLVVLVKGGSISNSLMYGTITTANKGTNTGKIVGRFDANTTLNTVYYADRTGSTPTSLYNTNSKTITGTPIETNTTNLGDGSVCSALGAANWIQNAELGYPIPGESAVVTYTLTYKVDGSTYATQEYEAGATITPPANPEKTGYTFDGWTGMPDPAVMPANALEVTAKFTAISEHEHDYINGFCSASGVCYHPYQEATMITDGNYEIDNGGQMYWLAEKINSGEIATSAKIKLTADIDLEGSTRTFPGICTDGSKIYTGTFDGNGKKITNFIMSFTSGNARHKGLIGYANNATIKNFSIAGAMTFNCSQDSYFNGAVVGRAAGSTSFEDITSTVNITVKDNQCRHIGGIAGVSMANTVTFNRCRYNGSLVVEKARAYGNAQSVGGIVGEARGVKLTNCLFDGTLTTLADGCIAGGLLGDITNNSNISNSLSHGTFNIYSGDTKGYVSQYIGMVFAYKDGAVITGSASATIKDCYYTSSTQLYSNADPTKMTLTNVTEKDADTSWQTVLNTLGKSNWHRDETLGYPIPGEIVCDHTYNKYGYCTKCEHAEDLEQDADGNYIIKHLAGLGEFRNLVNSSPKGTILNAKVTADIDVTDVPVRWGKNLIGDHAHPYCGTFDGQGYSFKGLDVTFDEDQRYVGVFECVGIKDTDASKAKAGIIKNFSVSGKLTATYFSNWNSNTPLCMGVIGEIYNGVVENVHSSVDFYCTSGTRAHIGGVVGGTLHGEGDAGTIVIKNCSYTGTINVNASDNIGGIVGYAQHHTYISNTLYAGKIIQNWTRNTNEVDGGTGYAQGPISTYIGGVLGYCNSTSNGVQNSIIIGDMDSNLKDDFLTDKMTHQKNNMNICVGYDGSISTSYKNYYGNYITPEMKTKYHQLPSTLFSGTASVYEEIDFASGIVCAKLNADPSAENDPWGQILGYQVGPNKDPNSPAQPYPFPGYTDPNKTSYKVVQTQNAEDNTKYDYTADYYFFDDFGDTTPMPSDAASMKVKRIKYTRLAQYMKADNVTENSNMTGFISVCMPFNINDSRLNFNSNWAVRTFYKVSDQKNSEGKYLVSFNVINHDKIAAGVPYFIQLDGSSTSKAWEIDYTDAENPFELALAPANPTNYGIFGAFNTESCPVWSSENPVYKLKPDGITLVKTNANSQCFPYRGYLKFAAPTGANSSSSAPRYVLCFDDLTTDIEAISETGIPNGPRYNILGQKVSDNTKGIVIVNGRKYVVK